MSLVVEMFLLGRNSGLAALPGHSSGSSQGNPGVEMLLTQLSCPICPDRALPGGTLPTVALAQSSGQWWVPGVKPSFASQPGGL